MAIGRNNYWQRRYNRRSVLRSGGAAGAGVAGLALVGCGGDDDDDDSNGNGNGDNGNGDGGNGNGGNGSEPTSAPDSSEITTGGTLTLNMNGSPRSLDPHFDTFPYNTAVTTNTNNALLRFTSDLTEIIPDIAVGMPEQPDDVTYTFQIEQGVRWQDVEPVNGREFTAEDVKYSIERQMTDDAGTFQHAYFFLDKMDSIEVLDEHTIQFKTLEPYAPFLSYIASPWSVLVNREAVEEYGDVTENAPGTGPFIFEEWQRDVSIRLRRNPDYWRQDENGNPFPYIDELIFQIVADPDTAATLFVDGETDGVVSGINQTQRIQDGRSDANFETVPSQFWRQMRMMPTMPDQPYAAPWDDIRVRQAIVQAQDPQQILDLVYSGDGVLTNGPILPIYENWALQELPSGAEFDLNAANALMEEAGNPNADGPLIWASTTATVDQVCEVHAQQLAEIGVNIALEPMELAAYYNQTYAYDYTYSSHTPLNNPDPDENLSSYFGPNSTYFKYAGSESERIYDLIDQQSKELDLEARQELVREVQELIVLQFPMKFLYTTNNHNFTGSRVRNWFWSTDLYDGRVHEVWLADA